MSAVAIVQGVAEGLVLLQTLTDTASKVSASIQAAQASGKPVDWSSIDTAEVTAEAAVVQAIAVAKAAGR